MPLLVDIRHLSVINELIREGATNVSASVESLTGAETTITIKSLSFVDPADLPGEMATEETYVATVSLTEPPYGKFLMTFSGESARSMAELVSGSPVEGELSGFQESALQEMCNICTSGFIDGIANTLDTTIDMGTPTITTGGEREVRTLFDHVERESVAIVLDSTVWLPEYEDEFDLHTFLVPAPGSFVNLLDTIDVESFEDDLAGEVLG